jgi:drug/metabolite transporter (DMT)-like permease
MGRSPDGATYAAFLGAVVIGGANFVAVTYSNMELPPLFGATLRFALASAAFFLIARALRLPRPRPRDAIGAALYGALGVGVAYALLYYSLVGLPAGTAAVIVAGSPLATLAVAVVIGQERLTGRAVAGGVLAIAGIGLLSLGTLGGGLGGAYLAAAILATLAIATSSVVAKACRDVHPVNMNAIGMVTGTLFLAAGSRALGESWIAPREAPTLLAVAWLVALGSVGMFQLFLFVIRRWSASATVFAVAAMPVVAVILGALLLDQPVTIEVVAGGGLVLAAVYLGTLSRTREAARPVAADRP